MKPIKTLRFGAERGDFDYLYGEYKSLEEAKKSLKWEASLGQQFIVVNEDKEVDLYLWQGKDLEPLLVTSDEDEDGSGGTFNPNGENILGRNFSMGNIVPNSPNSSSNWVLVNDDSSDGVIRPAFYMSGGEEKLYLYHGGLVYNYKNFSKYALTTTSLMFREDNQYFELSYNLSTGAPSYVSVYLPEIDTREDLEEPAILPITLNGEVADYKGDFKITPTTLINILTSATEAEKTQIKSLLGIS